MAETPLIKKLRIQTIQRLLVLNPPEGYLDRLPDDVEVSQNPEGKYPFVQLFARNSEVLADFRQTAVAAAEYDGLFWLCYPKKSGRISSDLSREVVWQMMDGTGLRPVTQISIDESWSALRFRPLEKVGK